jgi:hypothetical protein
MLSPKKKHIIGALFQPERERSKIKSAYVLAVPIKLGA